MTNRAQTWINHLTNHAEEATGFVSSVKVIDTILSGRNIRYLAIVPDENNPFVQARGGQVGLLEGWNIAKAIYEVIQRDCHQAIKTAIVAIIDVPSQAYGRREEAYGIHQSLAAAVNAYAKARILGYPIVGIIVGSAMSGGFLAHGYQANRLIALDDGACMVHAMGKESAARITLRSVAELEKMTASIAPMAYDIQSYASLGLLWKMVRVNHADKPDAHDISNMKMWIDEAIKDIENEGKRDLSQRLKNPLRATSLNIRQQMAKEW